MPNKAVTFIFCRLSLTDLTAMAAVIKSNPGAMSNVLHAAMQQMALLKGKAELVKVTLTQDMVERKTVDVPVSLAKSRTTDMNNMNAKDMNSLPW